MHCSSFIELSTVSLSTASFFFSHITSLSRSSTVSAFLSSHSIICSKMCRGVPFQYRCGHTITTHIPCPQVPCDCTVEPISSVPFVPPSSPPADLSPLASPTRPSISKFIEHLPETLNRQWRMYEAPTPLTINVNKTLPERPMDIPLAAQYPAPYANSYPKCPLARCIHVERMVMCPIYNRGATKYVDAGCRYCVSEKRKGRDKALPATPTERSDSSDI